HDNFVELGGTSLLATEVAGALRKEFGVDLALNTFLKSGTIRALAKEIKTLGVERDPALLSQEILSLVERLSSDEVAEMLNDSASIDQPLTLMTRSSYV
ncbi:MAG: phosphopantetheine-binding protein, partial [Gammaproteobacteria bacterium]